MAHLKRAQQLLDHSLGTGNAMHMKRAEKLMAFGADDTNDTDDTDDKGPDLSKQIRTDPIDGNGESTVAGIVHFAEITKLSGRGPQKVYCVGELHGMQEADTDYIKQYKQLLTANDESEDPDRIDFFIEDNNFPTDALLIQGAISKEDISEANWMSMLRKHLQGCYTNPEDIEYITGIDSTELRDQLTPCPYKHTHVHWADPGYFGLLWSASRKTIVYGMSYQENPEWFIEVQQVDVHFSPGKTLETFKQEFPHAAAHIEANTYMQSESNLYDIVEANPYIGYQLERSIYRGIFFRTWFDNAIAADKKKYVERGVVTENDYWWRSGIFTAKRRAMDIYAFLRMTRMTMSARGRFKNVIVHAGVSHTKSIVSLFRFADNARFSIIERDEETKVPAHMAKMNIDLCKAIRF